MCRISESLFGVTVDGNEGKVEMNWGLRSFLLFWLNLGTSCCFPPRKQVSVSTVRTVCSHVYDRLSHEKSQKLCRKCGFKPGKNKTAASIHSFSYRLSHMRLAPDKFSFWLVYEPTHRFLWSNPILLATIDVNQRLYVFTGNLYLKDIQGRSVCTTHDAAPYLYMFYVP